MSCCILLDLFHYYNYKYVHPGQLTAILTRQIKIQHVQRVTHQSESTICSLQYIFPHNLQSHFNPIPSLLPTLQPISTFPIKPHFSPFPTLHCTSLRFISLLGDFHFTSLHFPTLLDDFQHTLSYFNSLRLSLAAINKLYTVASGWTIIDIILRCADP